MTTSLPRLFVHSPVIRLSPVACVSAERRAFFKLLACTSNSLLPVNLYVLINLFICSLVACTPGPPNLMGRLVQIISTRFRLCYRLAKFSVHGTSDVSFTSIPCEYALSNLTPDPKGSLAY